MNQAFISSLRCISGCDSELSLRSSDRNSTGEIESGALLCPDCGREYLIQHGIVRMLPEALSEHPPVAQLDESASRKRSEMRARDDQVDDYDRMWHLNLFSNIEIPFTLKHLSPKQEHSLLEAGCGTGRMTRTFASKCDALISVDFSFESLKACAQKLKASNVSNVNLVQADLCHLPFRTGIFHRVVSCQVLEHIPTPQCRESAVGELSRVLRTGGKLVLSAYQYSPLMRIFGKKEGEHDGGIYYYRFDRGELHELLSRKLTVEAITGVLVYHYTARCSK